MSRAFKVCLTCYGIIFSMLPDLQVNDVVRLRKPHPCGGYEWTVTRLGADIGLECRTCGHRVMLTRRELARRTRSVIPAPAPSSQKSLT